MTTIPWYYQDERFAPGTVADIGYAFRLTLEKTKRKQGTNKWRLYMEVRTQAKHGVEDSLKRGVCVAQFSGSLTLEEAQREADKYLYDFLESILLDLTPSS